MAARMIIATALAMAVALGCGPASPNFGAADAPPSPATRGARAESKLPEGALLRLGRPVLAHPGVEGFSFIDDKLLMTWGPDLEDSDGERLRHWAWPEARSMGDIELRRVSGAAPGGRFLLASVVDGYGAVDARTGALAHRFVDGSGYYAALSADGRTLAQASRETGIVEIHATGDERPRILRAHERDILGLTFDPSGARLVTSSEDDTVKLWDVTSGDLVMSLDTDREASEPAFSADGKRLLARTEDRVLVWDAATGAVVARVGEDDHDLYLGGGAAISPDGKQVAISMATGDASLSLFDLEPLALRWQTRDAGAYRIAFSPDGSELVVRGAYEPTLARFAVSDGRRLPDEERALPSGSGPMTALASTAQTAYTGDASGAVTAWSLADGQPTAVLRGHDRRVSALSLSRDGKRLASGGLDRTVIIWDLSTHTEIRRITVPHEVSALALSANGDEVTVIPERGRASVWSTSDGRRVLALAGGTEGALARSADGAWLALSHDAGIALGSPTRWGARRMIATADEPTAMAFSPDGKHLAAASRSALQIWAVQSAELLVERELGEAAPSSVAWTPNGEAVAVAVDAKIVVASAAGARRMLFEGHGGGAISALAFATDQRLVSASIDGTALVWKVATTEEPTAKPPPPLAEDRPGPPPSLQTCPTPRIDGYGDPLPPCAVERYGAMRFHHESDIRRLAISPDGALVAAGGGSSSSTVIRVWERATGALRAELAAGGEVPSMGFSPSGERLYALSGGRVLSWSLSGDLDARSAAVGESDYNVMALSPSGELLAVANGMGDVQVLDSANLALRGRLAMPLAQVVRVGFAGEDDLIVQTMRLEVNRWSWRDGKRLGRVADDLYGFLVTRDGRVVGAADGVLHVGPPAGLRATSIEAGEEPMAVSADGRRVAVLRSEQDDEGDTIGARARVYELATGSEIAALSVGDTDEIALSASGDWLAVAKGMRVELWDVAKRRRVSTPPTHESWVGGVGFTARGKVMTVDRNTGIKLWERAGGARAGGWDDGDVTHGGVTPDGRLIVAAASVGFGEQLVVWPESGGAGRRKKVDLVSLEPIAISPDGRRLANAVPLKREVEIIALDGLRTERRIQVASEELDSIAFSPDGKVATSGDDICEVFRVADGQKLSTLDVDGALAFSPDGKVLAIATGATIVLRDATSFRTIGKLVGAVPLGSYLRFSKHGWLASADDHGGIQIWDVQKRKLVTVLEGHDEHIDALAVSPDGWHLLSGSWDGTALLWDIQPLFDSEP